MKSIRWVIGVAVCLLGATSIEAAKPKKIKAPQPTSLVSFEVTWPESAPPQTVSIAWPKEFAKVPSLLQVEASIVPSPPKDAARVSAGKDHTFAGWKTKQEDVTRFFAVDGLVSKDWQKNQPFKVSVRFSFPEGTTPNAKQSVYEAALEVAGYRKDTKRKVSLSLPLRVKVLFPSQLDCTAQNQITVGVASRLSVRVGYVCKNTGIATVTLSDFKADCGIESNTGVFPGSLTVAPGDTQLITGTLSLSPQPKEYACALSFLADGRPQKPPRPVALVRMSRSALTVAAVDKDTQLRLQGNGDYVLQVPAVPPHAKETTQLKMIWADPVIVKQVEGTVVGADHDAFQIRSEHKREEQNTGILSVQFSPTQPKPSYQATAAVSVTYEDATQTLRTEQIQVHLKSMVVVSHQVPLQVQHLDIPAGTQDACTVDSDVVDMIHRLRISMQHAPIQNTNNDINVSFDQFNGNLPAFRWGRGPQPAVCWHQGIDARNRSRLLPLTRLGTLDRYQRSLKTPTLLEHGTLPLVLQYSRKPLNLLVHAQFFPGVEMLTGSAMLGTQLEVMYQWSYLEDTKYEGTPVRRRKRRLNHLGLTWLIGSMNKPDLPVTTDTSAWNLTTALGLIYQGGGDLTARRNLSLLVHTGIGWGYVRSSPYLQRHDESNNFYGQIGLELRVRPSEKIPGLYLTGRIELGALIPDKHLWLAAPVGLEIEL